jgi:hypothetical protein
MELKTFTNWSRVLSGSSINTRLQAGATNGAKSKQLQQLFLQGANLLKQFLCTSLHAPP